MSPRRGLDRNTVINAAMEIANQEGLETVTIASLAKKLNVRPPSLYNHVEGLPAIKRGLSLLGLEQLYQAMLKEATEPGEDVIRRVGYAYLSYAQENPGLYEASLKAPDSEDKQIQEASKKIVDLAISLLAAYPLSDEQVIHAVRGLRSIFHGFSSLVKSGGFGMPLEMETSYNMLIDSFLAGLDKIGR